MDLDDVIRSRIGNEYPLVGVKVLKEIKQEHKDKFPKNPIRHCMAVKEAAKGAHIVYRVSDLSCPSAIVSMGFEGPRYLDVQPRIDPPDTKAVEVGPLDAIDGPDVILAILNPKQIMELSSLIDGGIEANFKGSIAVCGEATAIPFMTKKGNITMLCGGARLYGEYKDSELVYGAPPELWEKVAEKIQRLSKTCSALCGCLVSDLPPQTVAAFKDIGFEKSTDFFFGNVGGKSVKAYLVKDEQGKLKYISFFHSTKKDVDVDPPFKVTRRGSWNDISVTYALEEVGVNLNTGKGLKGLVDDIAKKLG